MKYTLPSQKFHSKHILPVDYTAEAGEYRLVDSKLSNLTDAVRFSPNFIKSETTIEK